MIKMAFYIRELIHKCELKNTGTVFFWQLGTACWAQEHLDLGPTTNQQVLKSTQLYKSALNLHIRKRKLKKKMFRRCQTALKSFVVDVA